MTMTKPTRRVFHSILGTKLYGWNDKRKYSNRVKFTVQLTDEDKQKLRDGLYEKYGTNYSFIIRDHRWKRREFEKQVTVVEYFKNEH